MAGIRGWRRYEDERKEYFHNIFRKCANSFRIRNPKSTINEMGEGGAGHSVERREEKGHFSIEGRGYLLGYACKLGSPSPGIIIALELRSLIFVTNTSTVVYVSGPTKENVKVEDEGVCR